MARFRLPGLPEPDPLPVVTFLPLGFPVLDKAMGGGIPLGKVIHVYGRKDAGKTVLAIYAMIRYQQAFPEGRVHYVDTERHFSKERAEQMGLDTSEDRFTYWKRSSVEGLTQLVAALAAKTGDFIVVDTLGNSELQENLSGDNFALDKNGKFANSPRVAGVANTLTRLIKSVAASQVETSATLWVNNQLRANIGTYGGPDEITPGGNAFHYNTTVDLSLRSPNILKEDGKPVGMDIRVSVTRSKYGYKYSLEEGEHPKIFYTDAVEAAEKEALYLLAVEAGFIDKSGSWLTLSDPDDPTKVLAKVQGEAKMKQVLKDDLDIRERIEKVVNPAAVPPAGRQES